jgi:hypothetical protein
MAGQPLGTKADVELAHFSDYLLPVPLLGASFVARVSNRHYCREGLGPYPLPVDLG